MSSVSWLVLSIIIYTKLKQTSNVLYSRNCTYHSNPHGTNGSMHDQYNIRQVHNDPWSCVTAFRMSARTMFVPNHPPVLC